MKKINLLITLTLVIALFTPNESYARRKIDGNRNVVSRDIEVSNFIEIDISLACKVYLKQGNSEELTISADENLHDVIDVDVIGDRLRIRSDYDIVKRKELTLYITVKNLEEMDISGAVRLYSDGELRFNEFDLDISGASTMDLELYVDKFRADLSGAVNLDLYGEARIAALDLSGSINFDADNFETKACSIDFSGFGKVDVYVTQILKAEVSGLGIIRYGGNPEKVRRIVSGLGSIRRN